MRKCFFLLSLFFFQYPGFSQTADTKNMLAGPQYTEMKYTISFADQSQMAYDGIDLKKTGNVSFMEIGDLAYYNGKYFNAAARYLYGVNLLPQKQDKQIIGLYKQLMFGIDTTKLDSKLKKIYTSAANTAGMMLQTRGKYSAAENLIRLAMDVRARSFGKTSREYLNSLHNLAVLKKDLGQYEEAEKMFSYLVPTFKKLFTVNSLQYVIVINNNAMLLAELGRTKEAIALLDEALKLGEASLDAKYIDYERILTNRALLEQESGNLDRAESYYLQALAGMEKKEFEDHSDYNNVLVYYGSLRVQRNDAGLNEFLDDVSDKVKRRYGNDHPLLAKAMNNLGDYYLQNKKYAEAKSVYNEAAEIQQKKLGEKHKDYLATLMKTAVCEWYLKDNSNAAAHFQKAIGNYLFLVNKLFLTMSESEKTSFWRTLKPGIDNYLSFIIETGQNNPALLKNGYELWIKTKGILINSTRQTRNVILNGSDSVTKQLYKDWLDLKTTLSSYYNSPLEDLKEDGVDLDELERQANAAEKELSRRSARFSAEYSRRELSFDDVRSKLAADEAAVEIIRVFNYYGEKRGEPEYAALVIKKNAAAPELLRIGNGTELEKYSASYKKAIKNNVPENKSYDYYWKPLESSLAGYKTIFFSPDGIYNTINPNVLKRNDGMYLIDLYNMVLVSNSGYIAAGLKTAIPLLTGISQAMLIGSPVFGNDEKIVPLPATKDEVMDIDTVLLGYKMTTQLFTDKEASEENIKTVSHPAVLHVATHGFFKNDVRIDQSMFMGVQVSKAKNNALLRSGLFLSGAASVYSDEPNLMGSNNGVLYAYEAMNLDLQGTQLVVLSACETGNGEIVNGEGVYGLCRSFQVAGASKILMSLWSADDKATRELMTAFYKNWIKLQDAQQAFILAQKTVKEKFPKPYFWGAFVMMN